jgi:hypothetical protein
MKARHGASLKRKMDIDVQPSTSAQCKNGGARKKMVLGKNYLIKCSVCESDVKISQWCSHLKSDEHLEKYRGAPENAMCKILNLKNAFENRVAVYSYISSGQIMNIKAYMESAKNHVKGLVKSSLEQHNSIKVSSN